MKNAILVVLLLIISNTLFAQELNKDSFDSLFLPEPDLINATKQSFSNQNGSDRINHFEFKVNKSKLSKLEPISPGQQPGWSYFWNYGDGNFYITTEELGEIHHTYTQNDAFLLRVEGTPIKTPEDDDDELGRILLDTVPIIINGLNSLAISPKKNDFTTKITNGKSVQLLSSRCAVPGEPFTVILSAENNCKRQINNPKITFSYNNKYIEYVDSLEYYTKDLIEQSTSPLAENADSLVYEITLQNQIRNEQRNYFANFQTKPNIEIGKEIKFIIQYENDCDTFSDTLMLETAKSHDPSFKLMTFSDAIENCEVPVIDSLDVFIHFENDGEGSTKTISIVDSIVPPFKIDTPVVCFASKHSLAYIPDSLIKRNDSIWEKPIKTILHTPDCGDLTLTKDTIASNYNDTITIAFDDIMLKGKKSPDYLTESSPIETMDEVKFRVKAEQSYSSPFFCNIADIYFDANEAESVFDCVFYSCDCDSLIRVRKPILQGSYTIILGDSTTLSPDYSKLDFTPNKYIWWPDGQTSPTITVSPVKDKLYMVAASYCDNESGIEKYIIGRKIVYVSPPGKFNTNLIIDTIVQHVSCFDTLDGSFQLKMTAGNYSLKWNDLRKSKYFTDSIKRDRMANGTYIYTITNYAIDTLTCTNTITINEPPPLLFEYKITKTQDVPNSLYNIESIVYGGMPDYEVTWKLQNGETSNAYNINNVEAGIHIVEVEDKSKWVLKDTIVIPDCDIIDPGFITDDLIEVCAGEYSEIVAENVIVIDDFDQFYVLHKGDLNSVIDFNKDGRFLNDITSIRNEELYVSSIVVPVDENGEPVLDYFCADIDLKSTPIVFYEPINITADVMCYKCKGTFDVQFSITGGAAGYKPNKESYLVAGSHYGLVVPGEEQYITGIPDGSNYEIHVIDDGSGWGSKLISEPIQCCKLPIELLSFKGEAKKEGNLLKWSTASEIENDYFAISYSKDGVEFEELQKVKGQGISSIINKYQYLHQNPISDLSYYKLSQTDYNGDTNVVGFVNVIRNGNQSIDLLLFPNPAVNDIQLAINGISLQLDKLIIYNNIGDKFYEFLNLPKIPKKIVIKDWPKGLYLVQVELANKIIIKKFIKY